MMQISEFGYYFFRVTTFRNNKDGNDGKDSHFDVRVLLDMSLDSNRI